MIGAVAQREPRIIGVAGVDKVGQARKDAQILNGADARFAGAEILGAVGRDRDEAEGRKIVGKRHVDDGAALAVERDMALPQQHGAKILARQAAEVAAPAATGRQRALRP